MWGRSLLKWMSKRDLNPYNECYVWIVFNPKIFAYKPNSNERLLPVWWQCTICTFYYAKICLAL
jgi:hypothetical protein